jgi:hypothetical protein
MFTSDKFWRSWWCMLEFCSLWNSMTRAGKGVETSVLAIEHESGRLKTMGDLDPILRYWDSDTARDAFPVVLKSNGLDREFWRNKFKATLVECAPTITSDVIGLRKVWSAGRADEILAWVKQKLGL